MNRLLAKVLIDARWPTLILKSQQERLWYFDEVKKNVLIQTLDQLHRPADSKPSHAA